MRKHLQRIGLLAVNSRSTDAERFLSKVEQCSNGCNLWLGAKHPSGYGIFSAGNTTTTAQRFAWVLKHDDIPKTARLFSTCPSANKACVNPDHWRLLDDFETEFWRRTVADPDTGCILWTGQARRDGYGQVSGRYPEAAHRVAYRLKYGFVPKNEALHHLCHRKLCVNASHLLPVGASGEHSHNALHHAEDVVNSAIADGSFAAELESSAEATPLFIDGRRIGSMRAEEVAAEEAA